MNQSTSKTILAALLGLYAAPSSALAAYEPQIEKALIRAAHLRASDIQPPGSWTTGVMLPRLDGRMNFDPTAVIPASGPRMLWVGGNGS